MTLARRLADLEEQQQAGRRTPPVRGPVDILRDQTRESLVRDLAKRMGGPERDSADFKETVAAEIDRLIHDRHGLLTPEDRTRLASVVADEVLGYGPIEPLLRDPSISEIMVNGPDSVYVERSGRLELTPIQFRTEEQLKQIIVRIAAHMGRRIDESSPMVDARLADGSRVNAVIPPLAVDGPVLTIRKFSVDTITANDLVAKDSLTAAAMELLKICVAGRLNIIVSGGTGTGKTTFLNILSSFIPAEDRIVTIEDAVELQLRQRHVIRLETRPANIEGRGVVETRDLVRNSLRMRPDRIIVGECRGAEALDMLQAMNTGHEGSLGTLHANTPRDALTRLETMVLMAGLELPSRAIREQVASAIDMVVQLERLRTGARVVTSITEVLGLDHDQVVLQNLFLRRFDERTGDTSELLGTGVRPRFTQKLARHGVPSDRIVIPAEVGADVLRPEELRPTAD
ncbi:MAG: CpaF family protein [Acidimicrobiales bacterium]